MGWGVGVDPCPIALVHFHQVQVPKGGIFLLKSHGMCLDNLARLGEGGGLSLTGNALLK